MDIYDIQDLAIEFLRARKRVDFCDLQGDTGFIVSPDESQVGVFDEFFAFRITKWQNMFWLNFATREGVREFYLYWKDVGFVRINKQAFSEIPKVNSLRKDKKYEAGCFIS